MLGLHVQLNQKSEKYIFKLSLLTFLIMFVQTSCLFSFMARYFVFQEILGVVVSVIDFTTIRRSCL